MKDETDKTEVTLKTQYNHVVIVLAYNDNEAVETYISQTVLLPAVDHILVVDNASTTGLYQAIQTYVLDNDLTTKVTCIQTPYNGGYAYGNNIGLHYVLDNFQANYISISNSDVLLNQEALVACMQHLSRVPRSALVAPKMVSPRPEMAHWPLPTYWDLVANNFILLQGLKKKLFKSVKTEEAVQAVDVIAGSFYMGRSEIFQIIDFLDERTFLYGEENILGYKIKAQGYQNFILNQVSFLHQHSTSINVNIQSVGKRLAILRESCHVYLRHYLNIGQLGLWLFDVTHLLGKYSYLLVKQVLTWFQTK